MKLGFIGCGNMAKAMIGGIINKGLYQPTDIVASDVHGDILVRAGEELGIRTVGDNKELVLMAETIILAIKPNKIAEVITEITDVLDDKKLVISIVAGQTLQTIEDLFGSPKKLIRVMPNTPALVGEGMAGVCHNKQVSSSEVEYACTLFNSFGRCEVVSENLMDAVVAVSGSSPAYVFMFIEAMADEAVALGMPRSQAYQFAAQAVLGSAKMVLETGKHPGELKDMVCSPAGTTIDAVKVLEKQGFRAAVMEAMQACAEKSRKL